ncbi:MAG TPA: tRNA (adenosine(37)-N6)-threonylcarbamoyltransferase complex dimerization subunit type 1 TsaB [Roseiarcus sp.]|jgi:tRNA threonylcarbamoyladenosine biosynthesis protein TsaB|nr:tRNA (adenosine(37)-N6)-threonylcarbamoyltransferase complex dimerization subunit type 1 TsaB [Roseiarcus sp.]
MRILAIDTSCGAVSACVMESGASEPIAQETLPMARGHAEALAPLLQRLMSAVDGGFASLDRVAATVGPGSFTGIRIGLATGRAIGLGLSVPVVGVSTLIAFAGPLLAEPRSGFIVPSIDAKHERLYVQVLESNGRPLLAPRLASPRDAARAIGAGPARLTGSGAQILASEAARIGLSVEIAGQMDYPDIVAVARLGLIADPSQSPPRPLYLKAPDAQPAENAAIARSGV